MSQRPHRRYNAGMRQVLTLHPDSQCFAPIGIEVEVARPHAGGLLLSYFVTGNVGALRMPPLAPAARADELWQHTCFEAFIGTAPGAAYYEFNFAPSTQWAAYRFSGYRSGLRVASEAGTPRIEVQSAPERYTLQALLRLDALSPFLYASASGEGLLEDHAAPQPSPAGGEGCNPVWHLGLSAVIEETNGDKSYWALAHPPGKPDFHHSDCFALELS
jgi:hypothetical protein